MKNAGFSVTKKLLFLRNVSIFTFLIFCYPTLVYADTAIETETAQIGKKGQIGISQSYEYARAKDGTSGGTLTQFEYGISDRAELLVEPFFYTWENPDGESKVEGLGDLEVTPSYKFILQDGWVPDILAAFKLKVPTGSEDAGSSGEFDYMPYFILGQSYNGWILNVNLGVNFVTKSEENDVPSDETKTWAIEVERAVAPDLTLFLEGFSTEDDVKTASTALEYEVADDANIFVAAGYTEEDESIFRVGFNMEFGAHGEEPKPKHPGQGDKE
jgi:hypothetical protein